MSDRSGSQFGPYQLTALLGRGGMGEVYRAYDTVKERVVAVKLLPPHLATDPDYERRFEREARTAGSVTDPHVVPIHNYGRIDGVLFLEMPLIDGTDLRKVLETGGGALSLERAVHIAEQVAGALDAAHAVGLTHRDVKPENVLITANDFCYLADFGIASRVDDTHLTEQGAAVGSLRYMAPERFGERPATPATDTYALGCIVYEMLAGRQAFAARSVGSITREQLSDYPTPPPDSVPPAAAAAIRQAIDKDPALRQSSSGELAAQLRAAVPLRVVRKKWSRWQWVAAATAVLLAISVGTAVGVRIFGGDGSETVVLMPADKTSPDGFTPSVVSGKPSETTKQPHVRRGGAVGGGDSNATPTAAAALETSEHESGGTTGLYGVPGGKQAVCDTEALVKMITKDKTRAKVWADLLGTTPDKIKPTVEALTPLILRADTLVVNSDYRNGKAIQYPAVLQAGTAVLVDRYGVPTVKCNCGNPLAEAPSDPSSAISGTPWAGWQGRAVTVDKTRKPLTSFTTTNVSSGRTSRVKPGSVATHKPDQPKDPITQFDFGNTTWSIDGLDGQEGPAVVPLRGGRATTGGSADLTWSLVGREDPKVADLPRDTDLNGDGHADTIQVLRFKGQFDYYVVWLWEPKHGRAVQAGQIADSDDCNPVESITAKGSRITVRTNVDRFCPGPYGSPRAKDVFAVTGDKVTWLENESSAPRKNTP